MKFKIETIHWHGCAYQTVQPDNFRGEISWAWTWGPIWHQWRTWCTESFGPPGDVWAPVSSRWYYNNSRLLFRRPADVTAFLLRWS